MSTLNNKIDFAVIMRVNHANPNGDPLNGNRPRTDYDGFGEITDVCIKRKMRDRLAEQRDANNNYKYSIFVQSDDRRVDEHKTLRQRADAALGSKLGAEETAQLACEKWFDVRAFGQLFAFKKEKKGSKKAPEEVDPAGDTGVSIGIRGPVTIRSAFSVGTVNITSTQITKSVSGEGEGTKRSSDTMGMKHRVDNGVYVCYGSMNPQLAEKTGFSNEDSEAIKELLPKLFENDESAARPAGSMQILKVIWWDHGCKAGKYSSAKVHQSLTVNPDGTYTIAELEDLKPQEFSGF